MSEPYITINGRELSESQAMTVRVALESFSSQLIAEGLGDDEHGKLMADAYLRGISEIRRMIFG